MFTENQQIALAIAPKVTSACSILALSYAISVLSCSPGKPRTICDRIFLGMFFHEIIRSCSYVAGTWMMPKGTEGVYMPLGTESTCAIQAFVSQLGLAPLYIVSLGFYYVKAIYHDFNVTKTQWMEKWCHLIPNTISITFAISLIVSQQYGVDSVRCWIPEKKLNCSNQDPSGCVQGLSLIPTVIFEFSMISITLILSIALLIKACMIEINKRKSRGHFRGKRKYLDSARRRKVTFLIKHFGCYIISFILCFIVFHWVRAFSSTFTATLIGVLMNSTFGLLISLLHCLFKLPPYELESVSQKFSLRGFALSKEVSIVTHGYRPEIKAIPVNDGGGIYMGDEDDDCDESEFDYDDTVELGGFIVPRDPRRSSTISMNTSSEYTNSNRGSILFAPSNHTCKIGK